VYSINLEINRGKLVAVVGSVGSGKSSLLGCLLGEMDKHAGTIVMQVGDCNSLFTPPTRTRQNCLVLSASAV